MKKRIRSVNFTVQETELLLSLIESKIDIIESKKCDSVTWQEKEFAWKTIETDFNRLNSSGDVYRDSKCLRLKFDSLKRDTRKKERIIQYERYNLGSYCGKNINTTQQFTELEKKVKDMIVPSVERQGSSSDSDQTVEKNADQLQKSNEDKTTEDDEVEKIEIEYDDQEEKPFPDHTTNLSNDSCTVAERSPSTEDNLPRTVASSSKKNSSFIENKFRKRRLAEEYFKEAKLEVINLQKQLIQQEIKREIAQTKVFQQEYEHKKQINELEKQHLLLKIQLTRTELEKNKS